MDANERLAQQMVGGGGGGMSPPGAGGPPQSQGDDPGQMLGGALMQISEALLSGQLDIQTAMQILSEVAGGGGGMEGSGAPQGAQPMPGGVM
jgi:hypothetical protein